MQLRHTCSSAPAPTLAQPDGRAERVAGPAVVPGDLVRGAEPLVDLTRFGGELVLERQRKPGADGLHAVLEQAALDARDPLQPHRPGAQVGALSPHSLLA